MTESSTPLIKSSHNVIWLLFCNKVRQHRKETINRIRVLPPACSETLWWQCIKSTKSDGMPIKKENNRTISSIFYSHSSSLDNLSTL
ncbi:hypothetical protein FACS1894124_6230 [Spirochaetia bacterium]|nr:hypothetical protein FACS1894124_6230 [Spirochaetia bacterium]